MEAKVLKLREDEVEITFPAWDSRHPHVWRIVRKDAELQIAKPGRGDFRLAYAWILRIPLHCWKKTVVEILRKELVGVGELPDAEKWWLDAREEYLQEVASLIMQVRRTL